VIPLGPDMRKLRALAQAASRRLEAAKLSDEDNEAFREGFAQLIGRRILPEFGDTRLADIQRSSKPCGRRASIWPQG
jgi:hypothetical protein